MYFFTESLEDTPDPATYELIVEITFQVGNNKLVGNVYSLGVGVEIGGSEVWVSELDMTVVQGGSVQIVCCDATTYFLVNDFIRCWLLVFVDMTVL